LNRTLGAVNVDTPDPAVNVMGERLAALSDAELPALGFAPGFINPAAAYGFRDQLQDAMALVHRRAGPHARAFCSVPPRTNSARATCSIGRHPPVGRGVRTHFSDDFLWLPFVTCRYVASIADTGVLDETISFLSSRELKPEEEAFYDLPGRSEESATLYQHCVRAIERG